MNRKKTFLNFDLPEARDAKHQKRRLRTALLLAHQNRSTVQTFGHAVSNTIQAMSKLQKGITLSTLAIAVFVIAAGVLGPSAFSVANAEAQDIVNRAFARVANMSDEQRIELNQKFQDRMHFKMEPDRGFVAMRDLSKEDVEAMREEMEGVKSSLTEALAEAQVAPDLQVISADELPTPGFFARAGRMLGFNMMKHYEGFEDRLANLPDEICDRVREHASLQERESRPVSFLVYTNTVGETVYLGLNEQDEPVVKFIQPEEGEFPFHPQGRKAFPLWGNKKGAR